jgi:uncharacterized protein (TIGR00369 family)
MSALAEQLKAAYAAGDPAAVLAVVPYARFLDMKAHLEPEGPVFALAFQERLIGNIAIPALHGGVVAGFLEVATIAHLMWHSQTAELPKTINFSIDYLRSARSATTHAVCRLTRVGRRVAQVGAEAWQEDRSRPVAVVRAHFLLPELLPQD